MAGKIGNIAKALAGGTLVGGARIPRTVFRKLKRTLPSPFTKTKRAQAREAVIKQQKLLAGGGRLTKAALDKINKTLPRK